MLAAGLNASALCVAGRLGRADLATVNSERGSPAVTKVLQISTLHVLGAAPMRGSAPAATPTTTETAPPPAPSAHSGTSTATPAPAVRYYGFHEVDTPARPQSDWPLDVDMLDEIGITRLVFEVMVSDRGEVVGCTVLDPSGIDETARRTLEERLQQTPLTPARRGGRNVASVRRIELLVEAPR